MENILDDIVQLDSYAKNLSDSYEKQKEQLKLEKKKRLQEINQQALSQEEEVKKHYQEELASFQETNETILKSYQERSSKLKTNYANHQDGLINYFSKQLLLGEENETKL